MRAGRLTRLPTFAHAAFLLATLTPLSSGARRDVPPPIQEQVACPDRDPDDAGKCFEKNPDQAAAEAAEKANAEENGENADGPLGEDY